MGKKNKASKYLLDICILTSGCIELFEKCLDAVLEQKDLPPYRIFIHENAVPQETKSKYAELYKKLPENSRVIYNDKKMYGYPAASNILMKAGMSPLIMLVTDDVILHQGSIGALVNRMDDPTIGICGMKLLFPKDSTDPGRPAGKVQHVGHSMNIRGEVEHIFVGWSPENPKCNVSRECLSVTGAAFIVRRNIFLKAGGFQEIYGLGCYEDADLCLTIRNLGGKVFIDTDAVGTHYVGSTARKLNKPFPLERNKMIFQQRHAGDFTWDGWILY